MIEEIVAELMAKLHDEPDLTEDICRAEVKNVIRELRMKRNYTATSMSEEDILKDIENYHSVVRNVAEVRCVKMGAEGEIGHSENGIVRSYVNEDDLWKGVHAYVRVF